MDCSPAFLHYLLYLYVKNQTLKKGHLLYRPQISLELVCRDILIGLKWSPFSSCHLHHAVVVAAETVTNAINIKQEIVIIARDNMQKNASISKCNTKKQHTSHHNIISTKYWIRVVGYTVCQSMYEPSTICSICKASDSKCTKEIPLLGLAMKTCR